MTPPQPRLDSHLFVRVSPAQRAILDRLAEQRQQSVAAVVREAIVSLAATSTV